MIDLDAWLPDPEITTCHSRAAAVDPDTLWAAARSVRLDQTRTIGHLVRWRIPGVPPDQSFMGLLCNDPFTLLDEGPHHAISGLCGRIWTLSRDYADLAGPDDFLAWSVPRTVRVLFAHWVTAEPGGASSTLFSEARVAPTDRVATMRLRALWLAVGPFERLIGAEALSLAATEAERLGEVGRRP
ncbi:MAG TPA: hypothetical protein VGR11_07655 [Solirubrobacteraceae bacterium]|nr:hypothetical protein [Solirubrobacteraceae bacterium]